MMTLLGFAFRLDGKCALVAGASPGIGEASAPIPMTGTGMFLCEEWATA